MSRLQTRPRLRRSTLAVAALSLSLMATACSSAADDSSSSETGGTYVMAINGLTNIADTQAYSGIGHRIAFDPIKAPLWQYVTFDENDGKVTSPEDMAPFLVDEYEVVDGGIELTLVDAVSAAGNPLTAEDVKWTFERMHAVEDEVGIGLAARAGLDPDEPVTVTGEKSLTINADVNYLTLGILEGYQFFPLDMKAVVENSGEDDPWGKEYLSENSATFGPYSISEFVPSESVTYTRNDNFDVFEPAWQTIVMRHVPDDATRVSLLQTGEAQWIGQVGLESLSELESDDRATVRASQFGGQDVLELTKTFEPFKDERVRQAISYAIDRDALAEGPYRGFANPSTSIISSAVNTVNSTSDAFTYDPEKARELLAEAGQEDLEFTIYANSTTMTGPLESVLTAVRQDLADVGVTVKIQSVASPTDYRAAYAEEQYEAWMRAEGPLQVDAQYQLNLYHHTDATSNFMAQSDSALDAAIEAAAPLVGEERQEAIAPGIQQFNDVMLNVPLVETARVDVYGASVCPPSPNLSYLVQPQYVTPGSCD